MVFGLFRRRSHDAEHKVYVEIVAQARQPVFYTDNVVPDTIDGRYDMILIHAILFFRRLQGEDKKVAEFGQNVFDLFFADMDASLREMGVTDTRVPKKVKVMGEAFYGRADAYSPLLNEGDLDGLEAAVGRNVYPDAEEPIAQRALAQYMLQADRNLAAQDLKDVLSGTFRWPDPQEFISAGAP
ncbi:cytochrome b pre-mRNA-processing protein 3 [Roseibium hamelinense]|uniref:Cytochrome b pre-mRNA-processing protein 3 n=1 Tax=Roseibium hamelinense TaxID=150831 RepID=A0A562TGC4_9HYPH|nr:ubiquinol-cytochrome C chaperone family protein [Roseibium hamelinense]MTI46187.1 ubiquinol-cytochrome C chaperone [Roseibium hamelinense]TWI92621.1 cytochrome b pre-mRNA-processing protein 3 [Roseibium hamelinense]